MMSNIINQIKTDAFRIPFPTIAMCFSQEQFDEFMTLLGQKSIPYIRKGSDSEMHTFDSADETMCIVCIKISNVDPIDVCALLAHEAMHIHHQFLRIINEHRPSKELDAYSIQSIVHCLLSMYRTEISCLNTKPAKSNSNIVARKAPNHHTEK